MKSWTILALLVAICAVFLRAGNTEETATLDDFEPQRFEDEESEKQLADSFKENPENDDDNDDDDGDENEPEVTESDLVKAENALERVNETPSDDEDEPAMFKRAPFWRRRRRRRRFRFRLRRALRRVCKWVYRGSHIGWKYACHLAERWHGDEESPRSTEDKAATTVQ